MNDKHREVQHWLDTVYGSDAVPPYEMNPTTIDTLWHLMKNNQRRDKAAGLVTDDLSQKTMEYSLQAERIGSILTSVGLSSSSLSQSGTMSLRTLVSMALQLHTKDTSNTSLMLAMSDSSQSAAKITEARKIEQKLLSDILSRTKTAFLKAAALNKALCSIEDQAKNQGPDLEMKAKQAGFLQGKAKEYRKNIQMQQKDLRSCGVDSSIYHSKLVRRSEELQELRDRLHPVRAKLDSYQKLPPDLPLARVKLEEARMELRSLEEQLNSHINMLHM